MARGIDLARPADVKDLVTRSHAIRPAILDRTRAPTAAARRGGAGDRDYHRAAVDRRRPTDTGGPDSAPAHRRRRNPQFPEYKGAPLDPERGPGLGCFWIQVVLLVRCSSSRRSALAGGAVVAQRGAADPVAGAAFLRRPDDDLPAPPRRRRPPDSPPAAGAPPRARRSARSRTPRRRRPPRRRAGGRVRQGRRRYRRAADLTSGPIRSPRTSCVGRPERRPQLVRDTAVVRGVG